MTLIVRWLHCDTVSDMWPVSCEVPSLLTLVVVKVGRQEGLQVGAGGHEGSVQVLLRCPVVLSLRPPCTT